MLVWVALFCAVVTIVAGLHVSNLLVGGSTLLIEPKQWKPVSSSPSAALPHTSAPIVYSEVVPRYSDALVTRFKSAVDLRALAYELLDPAKRGNSESQYYLAQILQVCGSRLAELSQGQVHPKIRIDPVSSRCSQFVQSDIAEIGDADSWIAAAARGEYPPAAYLQLAKESFLANTDLPEEAVRKLLLTGHPDVYFYAGINESGFGYNAADNPVSLAWLAIACQGGAAACGRDSYWVSNLCAFHGQCIEADDLVTTLWSHATPQVFSEAARDKSLIEEALITGNFEALRRRH